MSKTLSPNQTNQKKLGIPKENQIGEARVSATPAHIKAYQNLGFEVIVAKGAGEDSSFGDEEYKKNGAKIATQKQALNCDIVLKVNAPNDDEIKEIKKGAILIGLLGIAHNKPLLEKLNANGINALSMDCVPRISRAQSMDALSSMANIAGYRAVIEAGFEFGRFFGGQITAAGKIPPAKVLVIGAGVAGLAAIGTANSLGAIVRAFDTRPEVKEQVQSMGAEFLEINVKEEAGSGDGYAKVMSEAYIKAEMELFAMQAKEVDIIITTALIPGKSAPKLITKQMVESMRQGSVVVDLAAQNGGNCELTKADKLEISKNGVKIIGYTDLPSRLSAQSSQAYGTNLLNLVKLLCEKSGDKKASKNIADKNNADFASKSNDLEINFDDEILRSACVCKGGAITFPPPPIRVSASTNTTKSINATKSNANALDSTKKAKSSDFSPLKAFIKKYANFIKSAIAILAILVFFGICQNAPSEFLTHFMVFGLACVVGYYVVWNVNHALHTPLMSVTNAISGIIVVGALLQMGNGSLITALAFIGVLIASVNIFGGFVVTQRMLKMFRRNNISDNGANSDKEREK
ncbi:Re/Si-specific NAD(P)(+) transhydrogenase subunit alpha [Helicobacter sp. T3_23-1059]